MNGGKFSTWMRQIASMPSSGYSSTSTFRESGRVGLEFYTQIKTVYRAG